MIMKPNQGLGGKILLSRMKLMTVMTVNLNFLIHMQNMESSCRNDKVYIENNRWEELPEGRSRREREMEESGCKVSARRAGRQKVEGCQMWDGCQGLLKR